MGVDFQEFKADLLAAQQLAARMPAAGQSLWF